MERKIIIVDSASNSQTPITTDATTFGELKAAVRAAGINIEGKDWLEGLTKSRPMADDAVLPTNVSYKGQVTNNLVYMLTATNKNIKSGITRGEIMANIKSFGLVDEVKKHMPKGKAWSCAPTPLLEKVIMEHTKATSEVSPKATVCECKNARSYEKESTINYKEKYDMLIESIATFLNKVDSDTMYDITTTMERLGNETKAETASEMNFTSSDISSMFMGLK